MIYIHLDGFREGAVRSLSKNHTHKPLESLEIPNDASLVIVHGVLRGSDKVIQNAIAKGVPWVMSDNGHLGKKKRVCVNATNPMTYREGRRFNHGIKLRPWASSLGKNILVLPPSTFYMDTFKLRDFLNFVCQTLPKYTDRNIVVRPKPWENKARPWLEQLTSAYAVITWGSSLALGAMSHGIPTISLGWCPAKLSSFSLNDLETDRLRIEPPRMETLDNLTWTSFRNDEMEDALPIALETSRCKPIEKKVILGLTNGEIWLK